MTSLIQGFGRFQESVFDRLAWLDGLAPLALRLYLVPVFWAAGTQKIRGMDNTVEWFGNSDYGLGLPLPWLMAHLCAYTEVVGAVLLLIGLATRWISIPLIITLLVAIFTVHWDNGWATVANSSAPEIAQRLGAAQELLSQYGNLGWLTEKGVFVILNNGIEFAVTYLVMLLVLLFTGGGRYVSVDYYLRRLLDR